MFNRGWLLAATTLIKSSLGALRGISPLLVIMVLLVEYFAR